MKRILFALLIPCAVAASAAERIPFRITGRITYIREAPEFTTRVIAVENETDALTMNCSTNLTDCLRFKPGDIVACAGQTVRHDDGTTTTSASECRILGEGPVKPPAEASIPQLLDGVRDHRLTRFRGTLRDVTFSETASQWIILVVCGDRERIFVSVPAADGTRERLSKMLGDTVSVTGICVPADPSKRLKCGRTFKVASESSVRPLFTGDGTGGPIPDIGAIRETRLSDISALGRHCAVGRVIAVWKDNRALLRRDGGEVADLEFAEDSGLPRTGERIRAIGLPESDLYRINLVNVTWSHLDASAGTPPPAAVISPRKIIRTKLGYEIINSSAHGKPIAIRGLVRSVSGDGRARLHIESDGILVPVDASTHPEALADVTVGCQVEVSGTCVLEHEDVYQSAAFPRLKGFMVVVRAPEDVRILARPPWWTPGRLLAVVSILVATLFAFLLWNRALRNLALRKSRELLREQVEHVRAELKMEERTRLAVELHDSLAQNLTGVSLEIDTAVKQSDVDRTSMRRHLDVAARSLKSCRDELRNCLWDLRNRALEAPTMDDAIRQTLAPHVAGTDVSIRFRVPRPRISDNTAHAILRIIRELALNAIRHGGATRVWIAGSIDDARMHFSVRDNGRGFDPATAPGFAEGHYGLLGIRERIDELEGEFTLVSAPGKGAKATVSITVPHAAQKDS